MFRRAFKGENRAWGLVEFTNVFGWGHKDHTRMGTKYLKGLFV